MCEPASEAPIALHPFCSDDIQLMNIRFLRLILVDSPETVKVVNLSLLSLIVLDLAYLLSAFGVHRSRLALWFCTTSKAFARGFSGPKLVQYNSAHVDIVERPSFARSPTLTTKAPLEKRFVFYSEVCFGQSSVRLNRNCSGEELYKLHNYGSSCKVNVDHRDLWTVLKWRPFFGCG